MLKKKILALLAVSSMVFVGCGNNENNDVEEKPEVVETAEDVQDDEEQSESDELFDYKALGVEPVEYGDEFELGDNLKVALEEICYSPSGDGTWKNTDVVKDAQWQDEFVHSFLQNSWMGFDYLTYVAENCDGIFSKEQVEYIQYSLTGEYVEFNHLENDCVDGSQASSGFGDGFIEGYTVDSYSKDSDTVELTLNYEEFFEIANIDSSPDATYDVAVTLKKNPYSCFDGYSIISIEKTETTPSLEADNQTHYIYGGIVDIDEDANIIYLEYPYGDDYINGNAYFDHFVTIDCSDKPQLIEMVKSLQESGIWDIKVGFLFDDSVEVPFNTVKATSVDSAD